ncbi:MAG: DUF763 domain-containing protein [Candidatus Nezhaarchaeota archaeon]|nr:DUF763 domain-containing protein [Candidatus Nezhaarchaeota archaeon]MDW8050408.1 DUF763 domain-containing protein [Nitrososphaerota archaeon]
MVARSTIDLPLHDGRVPRWLYNRMVKLAECILSIIVDEYGPRGLLERVSDPLWFHALSCTLGYDWDSSGTTTVTCAAIREALQRRELGVKMCGGKGKTSRLTPQEIPSICKHYNIEDEASRFIKISKLVAKIDTSAIQAGYQLYHHAFFIAEDGSWAVIQQGMRPEKKCARRFHWLSTEIKSFVEEPHKGIVGNVVHDRVLNLIDRESREARRVCVEVAREGPEKVNRLLKAILTRIKGPLDRWVIRPAVDNNVEVYELPKTVNWAALERALTLSPSSFEELLLIEGMGPLTIRSLALIADLIFGAKLSWKDPVKYAFAFGGKDGVPHPVDVKRMDEAIKFLIDAVDKSSIDWKEKRGALRRLTGLLGSIANL